MNTIIIYAHPYQKSFNHAVLEELKQKISTSIEVIDLYQDDFDPSYSTAELALFSKGKTQDARVVEYQHKMQAAQRLIIVCPIWWNDIPAIVKGFVDKVFKVHLFYENTNHGVKGKLTNIEEVLVLTTSNSPTWYLKYFGGNAIQSVLLNATFKQLGVKKRRWYNLGNIKKISMAKRTAWLHNLGV